MSRRCGSATAQSGIRRLGTVHWTAPTATSAVARGPDGGRLLGHEGGLVADEPGGVHPGTDDLLAGGSPQGGQPVLARRRAAGRAVADAFGLLAAIWVAALTGASGVVIAIRMYET